MSSEEFLKSLQIMIQKEQTKSNKKIYVTFNNSNVRLYCMDEGKNVTYAFVDKKTGNVFATKNDMDVQKSHDNIYEVVSCSQFP